MLIVDDDNNKKDVKKLREAITIKGNGPKKEEYMDRIIII